VAICVVLTSGANAQIFAPVIKSIAVNVVNIHSGWRVRYQAMKIFLRF
jgi:hypothetical protein